ncbi:VQ motif-containing protein 9-like [Glycine soja]|uniref:VQ motif-containing protein 9 n=1 Tax=Glycine soja TaxID=3848 RepID=A0A445K7G1_GLYSO|nr:VQ motif-containing protein 9-like [Glycine soja]RZC06741.1 VQ motif-containing protein 9 [Glycine soja]
MDKSYHPSSNTSISTSSAANPNNNSRDQYLRHLNKLSQKISKPIIKKPVFDPPQAQVPNNQVQHQPPVYNINKNDFRDVVQKLTGSPAHDRISTPPPIQPPKPPSSRLQRIRPPPLPQITNRPPPLLNPTTLPRPQQLPNAVTFNNNFSVFSRPPAPLSPLPPFPTVHAPAESPISAYMRDLQTLVDANAKHFTGFSPLPPPPLVQPQPQPQPQQEQQPQQQQGMVPSQAPSSFQMPSSPVPFGCLNSQLASYPLLSPGLLFSPTSGQLGFPQLPLSPTVPVPSPRWKGI